MSPICENLGGRGGNGVTVLALDCDKIERLDGKHTRIKVCLNPDLGLFGAPVLTSPRTTRDELNAPDIIVPLTETVLTFYTVY